MISSACNSTACGIFKPMARAVPWLITSCSRLGCQIGRSPGWVPLKTRLRAVWPVFRPCFALSIQMRHDDPIRANRTASTIGT